ncbi:hypothetical protein BLSTO_02012 [Blastocystis sp. subtype 1]
MGSRPDYSVSDKIQNCLKRFQIKCDIRIASAHKTPKHLLQLIEKYEALSIPKVYITVTGRSNALSGITDAAVTTPVIICPPYSTTFNGIDIFSSIRMPSGVCPMLVQDPENAGLAAAKILAVSTTSAPSTRPPSTMSKSYFATIDAARANTLSKTNLEGINTTNLYVGKVRDRFESGDKVVLITTDRMSGFDRELCTVPFKGQVLNLTSAWWFKHTEHIIPNHVLAVPDPNVTIGRKCTPFPIEFVMRGYITGSTSTSLWTNYQQGVRKYCGIDLPEGLKKNQKLWENLITPTTKSDVHDELISPEDVVSRGFMSQEDWDYCSSKAKELFAFGQKVADEHGLILVDTKYEFGKDENGVIRLIDEIHTPDSSRYWLSASYEARFAAGENPENIDKEFLRTWYRSQCDPYKDEVLPEAPADMLITGEDFQFPESSKNAADRIHDNVIANL